MAALNRQQHQVVDREPRERGEGLGAPLHAARAEARAAAERLPGELAAPDAPQQRLALQACAVAGTAGRIGAVARQQHPHVHLVGARLEPREEALHPVPDLLGPRALALDHPATRLGGQLTPGSVERNAAQLRESLQVLLAFLVGLGLPRLDGPAAERAGVVGNDEPVVDPDGAAEPAAALAGPERRVERELARDRRAVREVAVRAVQLVRIAPGFENRRWIALVDAVHVDAAAPDAQRRLERLEHPAALGATDTHPVLHHFEHLEAAAALAPSALACAASGLPRPACRSVRGCRRRGGARALEKAGVTLAGEELPDFLDREIPRHRHRKAHQEARVARLPCAREDVGVDAVGCVALHRPGAALAEEPRGARKQQLQVIVELGHRPDGRARGAYRVRLIDGYGGRNSRDRLDLRLIHPIEELPRVRGERLDVAPLAFRVQSVENQRRLAGTRHAGDHDQRVERQIEIQALEVILSRATHEDGVTGSVGHSTHLAWKQMGTHLQQAGAGRPNSTGSMRGRVIGSKDSAALRRNRVASAPGGADIEL